MSYVGVEFSENDSIALVHSSWLTPMKREVFWPPYKTTSSFDKALAAAEEPNQSTWKIYSVKRSFFESDDINQAKRKLKRCEETSDACSTEPDTGKRKRTRINKQKCFSDCSSSEEEGGPEESILPRPPSFSKPLKKSASNKPGGSSQLVNNTPAACFSTRTYTDEACSREHEPPPAVNTREVSIRQPQAQNLSGASTNLNSGGLEKVFQEIRKLREEVKEVKALLKQSRGSAVAIGLPGDIPVEFPLKLVANFQRIEEYLNVEDKHNNLASYLSSLGGTGTTVQVNRILRFLMTNELATHFNFAGQRSDKLAFCETKLQSAIISGVQLKSPTTTQVDIQNATKIWLKHAKQRMDKKAASAQRD